jgi:glycosyltransferase involved in cell wall biosynthesis
VIATARRETRLAFALEALAAQTLERFEVVVVRAPGGEGPRAPAPENLRVRFLDAPTASRPGQRNIGWRAGRGELIAFTDDDCRPAPGWLEELLGASAGEETFVQGRTQPDPDERHLLHGLARSVEIPAPSPWFETCNIAYPRALLERLGGFDERFERSGEDTDLGLRALESGARHAFAERALVHHAVVAQPLHRAVEAGWERWESTPLVFRRHPEHRGHLFAGVFYNRTHAKLAALLAGALAARHRPLLGAALAVPYVADSIDTANLGPRGLARQLVHLPAKLSREMALMAGLARGAIRHRSPVL